jgi:hypothetical protein
MLMSTSCRIHLRAPWRPQRAVAAGENSLGGMQRTFLHCCQGVLVLCPLREPLSPGPLPCGLACLPCAGASKRRPVTHTGILAVDPRYPPWHLGCAQRPSPQASPPGREQVIPAFIRSQWISVFTTLIASQWLRTALFSMSGVRHCLLEGRRRRREPLGGRATAILPAFPSRIIAFALLLISVLCTAAVVPCAVQGRSIVLPEDSVARCPSGRHDTR